MANQVIKSDDPTWSSLFMLEFTICRPCHYKKVERSQFERRKLCIISILTNSSYRTILFENLLGYSNKINSNVIIFIRRMFLD